MNNNKVYIIAEAGVNHNGDINIAKKMIDKAKEIGVDAIKFQSFKADNLVTKTAKQAKYQSKNIGHESTQYEMLKKLEISYEDHIELINYCKTKDIEFISSPFDLESAKLLAKLGVEKIKIPSGEIENVPLLRYVAGMGKEVIISTGMSTLGDIEFALNILNEAGCDKVTVLHCNTNYPTEMKEVNLNAMNTIRDSFKVDVGYSDHTDGVEVSIAAVALGARVIEKHFTLDKNMEGPDHKASSDLEEFKILVNSIRNIEIALGNGIKSPTKSEKEIKKSVRKSIVAKKDIKKGEKFTDDNITIKRPAGGISPKEWDNILGQYAEKNYCEDEMI